MPFEFKKTEIEGLMLIKPHMYPDERGLYKKYYEKNIFAENGITCEFTESSDLYSKKGALRGLHYQTVDSQAKLIHVISGVLFDVALDLRENSPTFGQYHTELLKADLIDAMHIMPDMKELTGQEIDTRRWNISTFGRLYMASALPETVHKVLNVDCDTIIVDTIEPLWNTDMTGKVFGGMLECINDRYRRNVGKNDGDYYLNGGIVFLNLDEVRVGNYERKFTDYITKYGSSLAYLDQDVLNGVVEQEKKVKLPMRYNTLSIYFYATYEQVLKIRRSKSQDFYSKEEFSEAISNPGLVHFTTCFLDGLRPWIKGNQHPYLKTFLKYKEMSPWRDIPLQEDKRSGLVKFRTTMIRKAPRFVLCEVASVLHGVIIPEKNYKRMQERVKE